MDPKAIGNLRMDRRLLARRGWIDPEDLEKELASLPDASDKIADSEESETEPAENAEG